jgi:hypothetical protein
MVIFETRNELLSLVPKNGVIAELGVFKGDFSKKIYEICQPSKLILIDIWSGEKNYSGDVDGNFPNNTKEYFTGNQLFEMTQEVVKDFSCEVHLIRNSTSIMSNFPNDYFDMIYIDADHSYEGVKKDLQLSFSKIKNGGFIMGHDYGQNMEKTKNVYNFGVKKAVDEFCINNKQQVEYQTLDGCTSFGIKITKSS